MQPVTRNKYFQFKIFRCLFSFIIIIIISNVKYTKLKFKMMPTIELLHKVFVFKLFLTILSYFHSLSFIIQTMYSVVVHENEFQLLFQKFAFTNDIVIPI